MDINKDLSLNLTVSVEPKVFFREIIQEYLDYPEYTKEAFENCVAAFFDEILVDSVPNIDELIKQTKEYLNQILTFDK